MSSYQNYILTPDDVKALRKQGFTLAYPSPARQTYEASKARAEKERERQLKRVPSMQQADMGNSPTSKGIDETPLGS